MLSGASGQPAAGLGDGWSRDTAPACCPMSVPREVSARAATGTCMAWSRPARCGFARQGWNVLPAGRFGRVQWSHSLVPAGPGTFGLLQVSGEAARSQPAVRPAGCGQVSDPVLRMCNLRCLLSGFPEARGPLQTGEAARQADSPEDDPAPGCLQGLPQPSEVQEVEGIHPAGRGYPVPTKARAQAAAGAQCCCGITQSVQVTAL